MTEQQYNQMVDRIRNTRHGVTIVRLLNKLITYGTELFYPILLAYIYIYHDMQLLYQCILVPGVSYVVVSTYRRYNHSKRPYEVSDIQPLIIKHTKEKSFPSRHVFAIFMIAMTALQVSIPIAIIIFACGILLGCLRVIGGVHFPKDVIAGAVIGILCGCIGYYLIF